MTRSRILPTVLIVVGVLALAACAPGGNTPDSISRRMDEYAACVLVVTPESVLIRYSLGQLVLTASTILSGLGQLHGSSLQSFHR